MALTVTKLTERLPKGNLAEITYEVAVSGGAITTDGFVTDLSNIVAVTGAVAQGTGVSVTLSTVINADDTSGTAGETPGSLGVEASAADTFHITVLGRP